MEWVYGIFVVMVIICIIVQRRERKLNEQHYDINRANAAMKLDIMEKAKTQMVEPWEWMMLEHYHKKEVHAHRAWNRANKKRK